MKNMITSLIIFILITIFIVFSTNYLNKKCYYYREMSNSLEQSILDDAWEKSYTDVLIYLREWRESSSIISIFVNHENVDSINRELLKLTQYVKNNNKDDSLAIIHEIKFLLDNISSSEKITIQNIFWYNSRK